MTLTVGSLFSGIGGLDLGLERSGMRVIWQSEIDPYACKVLSKHWPQVANHGDIKQIEWDRVERPDVICGGYPCQPFSTAGKRQGKDDPRHLWPWVLDAIRRLRPKYAILENVRGHLTLGGVSVIGDLAAIGYNAEWRIVSASSVGAPHRRERIIIVAYPQGELSNGSNNHSRDSARPKTISEFGDSSRPTHMANTTQQPSDGRGHFNHCKTNDETEFVQGETRGGSSNLCNTSEIFGRFSNISESNLQFRTISDWWKTEPELGRMADGIPSIVDRLRCLGNAVVPQVAEVIGRMVVEHEKRI